MNGSLVNSSKLYCHSQVSCPNVPFVTNNTPLKNKKESTLKTEGFTSNNIIKQYTPFLKGHVEYSLRDNTFEVIKDYNEFKGTEIKHVLSMFNEIKPENKQQK